MMDPFMASHAGRSDCIAGFARALRGVLEAEMESA